VVTAKHAKETKDMKSRPCVKTWTGFGSWKKGKAAIEQTHLIGLLMQPIGKICVYTGMIHPASVTSPVRPFLLQTVRAITLGGMFTALTGCVVEEVHRRPPPPIAVVEVAPPPPPPMVVVREAPRQEVIVVQVAPPPPRREIVLERERPSPRHVWIKGYWVWRGSKHEWVVGHWELPPRANAVWVEPRWEQRGNGYVFIAGFWL
jgi:hypothetical protein